MAKSFQVDTGGTLTTGLVSYYKLGDTYDFYGSNNLTNNGGATFGAGKYNNGVDFGTSNTSKYLSIASNLGIDGGNFSTACWYKPSTAPATNAQYSVVSLQSATSHTTFQIRYLDVSGTKKVRFARVQNSVADTYASYDVDLGTGTFYHLAMTYDGTNIRGYLNGSLVAGPTAASGNGSNDGRDSSFSLGSYNYDAGLAAEYASGVVDEVPVYSKALSTTEISDLYNSGNGQTMNPPIEFSKSGSTYANPASSLTIAYTQASGSNRILMVETMWNNASEVVTGVTVNGVAMTRVNGVLQTGQNYYITQWYLTNPTTGDIVASSGTSAYCEMVYAEYVGADQTQSSIVSDSNTEAGTAANNTFTVTPSVADSWVFCGCIAANVVSAGAGAIERQDIAVNNPGHALYDNGSPVNPTAATDLTVNFSSAAYAGIITAIAPYVAPSTTNTGRFFAMF